MRGIQKIILIFYIIGVFFLSVVYKPLVRLYGEGLKDNVGHFLMWDYPRGYYVVDSSRILVELFALTAMATAALLFFKRE